ncbi:PAS domain S-box protein [Candidatus Nitrospira bockiana]
MAQTVAAVRNILIVDDDQDIRDALTDMLEHDGYRVDAVATGTAGVHQAGQQHYGAVLLDIGLPDLDGHSVLKAIRDADPELPVIILTGHVSEQNTIGPLTKGAFASVLKPYNPLALKAVVRRACEVRALSVKAHRVEHELSESEERFRSVVQSTSDAVIISRGDGQIVSWNKSAERMFLYTEEEILGRPLTTIMPARYREAHEAGMRRVQSNPASSMLGHTLELYGLRKDGTEFPLELSLAMWKTSSQTFFGGIIRDITDRKRAEAALRRSEERFRQLAENIKEVFWLTDAQHTEMIYISPAYEEIWGQSCESLYARPNSWLDAIHPDDRRRVEQAIPRQASGEYQEEYRIVRPDGTVRWVRDRAFPIRDESGTLTRIAGIAECITADKIADQQQAAQYAVTRVLAEAGSLAEAAPKILQAIGEGLGWDLGVLWTVDESGRGLRCLEIWRAPGVNAQAFEAATRETIFAMGVGLPGRVWHRGQPAWIADVAADPNFPRAPFAAPAGLHGALAFPISLHGKVLGVLECFVRDVRQPDETLLRILASVGSQIGQFVERREAEQALHAAYDKLDAIMVSLPCLILIVDHQQRVLYANPLAGQHFPPEDGTLIGSRLQDLWHLSDAQWLRLLADLDGMITAGKAVAEREMAVRRRAYRYRLFPVTLRGNNRQQAGVVMWDVTEQKLLQDQLIQAEKLASLGTLVSGMAHEINNPVQGILGMAEIILNEEDPEKVREYARDIVRYSEHVGMVVRNFACYARPASRDGEMEIDVGERLMEAVRLVQRCPQFGHVEVCTAFEPIPKFRARRTEIDQVFVNLISNAVEAMTGSGRLTLSTGVSDGVVTVAISDTGCGIPKAMIGKIFDPFVTTKEPGKGTGLGLSIVYKIIAKYSGRITVESEEGRGSTFTVQFPIEST